MSIPQAVEATGVITETDGGFEDYFGFGGEFQWYFPDGKQYIVYMAMNEGQKKKFQQQTNRDVRFNRRTDDAILKGDVAADRWALIEAAVTNWYMKTRNPTTRLMEDFVYSPTNLKNFLAVANPQHIESLEKAIRKANPWLLGETTVEDIDQQIAELQEVRNDLEKSTAGK